MRAVLLADLADQGRIRRVQELRDRSPDRPRPRLAGDPPAAAEQPQVRRAEDELHDVLRPGGVGVGPPRQ